MEKIGVFEVEQFRANVSQVLSQSQMPIWVVYYVMKDMMSEISDLYNQEVAKSVNDFNEKKAKEQKENTEDKQDEAKTS